MKQVTIVLQTEAEQTDTDWETDVEKALNNELYYGEILVISVEQEEV